MPNSDRLFLEAEIESVEKEILSIAETIERIRGGKKFWQGWKIAGDSTLDRLASETHRLDDLKVYLDALKEELAQKTS